MCTEMVCVFCHFKKKKPKVREMHLPIILLPKVQFSAHMLGLHLGQDMSGYDCRSGDCPRRGAVQREGTLLLRTLQIPSKSAYSESACMGVGRPFRVRV